MTKAFELPDFEHQPPSHPALESTSLPPDLEAILQHRPPSELSAESTVVPRDLEAVYDIPVLLSAVLGRATMPVNQLLKLGRGAVVELDRKLGEPVDIFVNNRLIARGEVVMVDEQRLGITMTEIVKSERPY